MDNNQVVCYITDEKSNVLETANIGLQVLSYARDLSQSMR